MSYRRMSVNKYLSKLASGTPIPGGGSAAAMVGALGISLSLMVVHITIKKVSRAEQKKIRHYINRLEKLKKRMERLIDKDPSVYQKVVKSYTLSKTNPQRTARIQKALRESYAVMKVLCVDLLAAHEINRKIFTRTRGAILNDLCVSEAFIRAALSAGIATASLNVEYIKNKKVKRRLLQEIQKIDGKKIK